MADEQSATNAPPPATEHDATDRPDTEDSAVRALRRGIRAVVPESTAQPVANRAGAGQPSGHAADFGG